MNSPKKTREEWLVGAVENYEKFERERAQKYLKEYFKINRGSVLANIAKLPELKGLKSLFLDNDLSGLKQNFYVASKLMQASNREGMDAFAAHQPFLYGLLSDSPEIIEWLKNAELKDKDYVKGNHFIFHQFQLILRCDDDALRETIALVAQKGGKQHRTDAAAGTDFFSLVLSGDKAALQTHIENATKMKSHDEYLDQFLKGYAVILAKLCWIRGIEVGIKNPLIPMPLLPVKPLKTYDVEYDFLRPNWIPPQPGVLHKLKQWFN